MEGVFPETTNCSLLMLMVILLEEDSINQSKLQWHNKLTYYVLFLTQFKCIWHKNTINHWNRKSNISYLPEFLWVWESYQTFLWSKYSRWHLPVSADVFRREWFVSAWRLCRRPSRVTRKDALKRFYNKNGLSPFSLTCSKVNM